LLGASLALILASACSPGESDAPPAAKSAATPSAAELAKQQPGTPQAAASSERADEPVVVFLGTSLTAGYGLPESQAFPALVQRDIEAAGLDYRVVNAGVSGDTSAGGLRRLGWLLRLPIAVLVLELGANDMLRGQSVDQLRANLEAILDQTRKAHPDVRFLIAGMRAVPNLGPDYAREFDAVYPALAAKYDATLVPFLLEDVAAKRALNQADGIHPTAAGHELIAERIWRALEPILRQQTK
jgi:acyl-CoA thioesterase-1